jgi:cell division protein FtsL
MDRFEKFFVLFIILLFLSLSIAVIKTAYSIQENVDNSIKERQRTHLPTKCSEYYDNGTEEWQECMLVEKKR